MLRNALLGLLFLAAPAAAQSPAIIGRDNAAFARELYLRGWTDLAEGVVRVFTELDKQGKADHLELLAVQAVGLDLKLDVARRDPDIDKRRQVIAEVIAAKEKLIEDSPRTEIARTTRDNLPDAYRLLGEALSAALEKETNPSTQASLREEGQSAFARVENGLQQRLDTLHDQHLEETRGPEDLQYMNALFNLGRTRYFHARFYPKGSPNSEALLDIAIKAFEDLGLDYPDLLINYEGTYFIGLCHKALGKNDEALSDWDYNIAELRDKSGITPNAKGRFDLTQEVVDIVSKSSLQKVLLLSEMGKSSEAIAAADDFWNKIVDPETAASGLAVLGAKADVQLAASDTSGAGETAKKLIELDSSGPWGNKGREIQLKLLGNSGSSIGPGEILRVAQQLNGQGKDEQALEAVRQVLIAAKGDAKEQDYGSQALFLMGQIYRKKGLFHEASLVFDTSFERYPKGVDTPNALAFAIDCYGKLNAKEKRPYYKTRKDERGQTLVREYPNHPAVGGLQQSEARELMDEGKFPEAAQLFRSVPASSNGYAEAQMQAGTCLYQQAKSLVKEKQLDQAKAMFAESETLLVKSLDEITTAKTKSLDQQVLAGLFNAEYRALTTLAKLYLEDTVNKPDKALSTLQGVDERFSSDAEAIAFLWQLRIRAEEKLGRVDEAVAKFDELYEKPSNHAALSGPASVLARSLDSRATELAKDPAKVEVATKSWRKAVDLYVISVQPQLDNHSLVTKPSDLEAVGKRLLDLGMKFNGVAEDVNTFIGWHPAKSLDRTAWDAAAKIYEVVVEVDPANYRARIRLGRVLGFLARWRDAAMNYASMFEHELLVKPDKSGFDNEVIKAKSELLDAYQEWGVCEAEAGVAEKSVDSQARASGIFDLLVLHTQRESPLWWNAKYRQIFTLYQRGIYEQAKVAMNNLERSSAADFKSAPADLIPLLLSLRTEVSKMVLEKPK